jgi:hypothetical protein
MTWLAAATGFDYRLAFVGLVVSCILAGLVEMIVRAPEVPDRPKTKKGRK